MNKVFVCKGKRLCGFLISKGLTCFKADVDKNNPDYMVYLFERTQELESAMKEWQSNKRLIDYK